MDPMRGVLFVALIAAGAVVYACDSFEEGSTPATDAGAGDGDQSEEDRRHPAEDAAWDGADQRPEFR